MNRIMGINVEGLTRKYLGLPTYIGKRKAKNFRYIREKVWKEIQGWKLKLFQKQGKKY